MVVVVVVVVATTAIVGTTIVGLAVVYTTEELVGWLLDRVAASGMRCGIELDIFTHVPGRGRVEGGGGTGFDELSDFEACPGRERVVGEDAKVSAASECPGKGWIGRHSVFKGGGRGGNDKSSDVSCAECPGKERVVGREVGETCVKGLDVVETELDLATRAELFMAFAGLDSL